jgi:hypothetical protein
MVAIVVVNDIVGSNVIDLDKIGIFLLLLLSVVMT